MVVNTTFSKSGAYSLRPAKVLASYYFVLNLSLKLCSYILCKCTFTLKFRVHFQHFRALDGWREIHHVLTEGGVEREKWMNRHEERTRMWKRLWLYSDLQTLKYPHRSAVWRRFHTIYAGLVSFPASFLYSDYFLNEVLNVCTAVNKFRSIIFMSHPHWCSYKLVHLLFICHHGRSI